MNRAKFQMSGKPVLDGRGGKTGSWVLLFACLISFAFGLTCTYLAGREVMKQGGFVAVGGPYEIAHRAENWVWIVPIAIFMMIIPVFVSLFALTRRIQGPNLMSLSWSAIFLTLGWAFVEFGFGIGMGGGVTVGWVICAAFFIPMGMLPLVLVVRSFAGELRKRQSRRDSGYPYDAVGIPDVSWTASLLGQAVAAAAGAVLGILFFGSIS
jgi:hypothetical protein